VEGIGEIQLILHNVGAVVEAVNEMEETKEQLHSCSRLWCPNWKKHLGKSLSQRERVARASGPGEGYRIY
jgi:hypothetical protein